MHSIFQPGPESTVRKSDRACYDWRVISEIIDAVPIGHVGFTHEQQVFVIPINVWRMGDHLYLHCLKGGRLDRLLTQDRRCCISFAEHNAWVLSKSAYHTSANYRSVVVYGAFSAVTRQSEFMASFETFLNGIEAGRWSRVRPLSAKEIKVTSLLRFTIDTGSAKSRTGKAKEEPADMALEVPAGIVPLVQTRGELEQAY